MAEVMAPSDPQCAWWIDWSAASESHRQSQFRKVRAVAGVIGDYNHCAAPVLVRGRESGSVQPDIAPRLWPIAMAAIFVVALYGGYFGGGIGILMIGALTFISPGDIRHVVALKNFLNGWMRGVAVLVLVLGGNVNWKYGAPMAIGGLVGGYIGGIVSHRANRTVVRSIVIGLGLAVSAYYFWKLYGQGLTHVGGE